MVLLGTKHLDSAFGLFRGAASRGLQLEALSISVLWTLQNIFFNLCKACEVRMSSFPPSMFTAGRARDTQKDRDKKMSKGRGTEPDKFFNTSFMELTPLKYNSKLMNSIWGFYNRYSPHNVKNITDGFSFNVECQQSAGNSTNKVPSHEPVIALPSPKLDNVWAAVNVSQSH